MSDLVNRLEQKIRRHVLTEMTPEDSGALKEMALPDLLTVFGNWRYRYPPPRARQVHISRELEHRISAGGKQPILETLIAKIEAGVDLKPHLSRNVEVAYQADDTKPRHCRKDLDLLLAEWGVHHLHLSETIRSNDFVQRTDALLFAAFNADWAYLIDIYPHGSWAKRAVVETIVRNWPEAGLFQCSNYAIGLSQHYGEGDGEELRNGGVNQALEIDGKVYSPPGQTLAGTPLTVSTQVMSLVWHLEQWRSDTAARLTQFSGGEIVDWLPAIRDGQCGFAAKDRFAPVGALP